jgi:phosphopantetheine--protein transferase-like protein
MVLVGYTELRELTEPELSLLPEGERDREFGSSNRRQQFQCGHALLRLLLQRVTGHPAAGHTLTTEEGGKPIGPDGIAVSITHTGNHVACSVADGGNIGIDLEGVDERREVSQITERFFSAEEKAWLESGPKARFYMLWVLKEAFVKAHGQSVFGGIEKLHCIVDPPRIMARATEASFQDLSLYRRDKLFLAVATTETSLNDVQFVHWAPAANDLKNGDVYNLLATTNRDAQKHAA